MPPHNEVALVAAIDISIRLLRYAVEDDTVTRLMDDLARSIRRSEEICDEANKNGDQDDATNICDEEVDYIEDLLGVSFVVLQMKIRRVFLRAVSLNKDLEAFGLNTVPSFENQRAVLALGDKYGDTGATLVELAWDIGNYFKHRDEWLPEVWDDELNGETNSIARRTRKSVERVGIVWNSTAGNMRTACECLGVIPYSSCAKLAEAVQHWADHVHNHAQTSLPIPPEVLRRARAERYRLRRRTSE
jgi:hypothetical protein